MQPLLSSNRQLDGTIELLKRKTADVSSLSLVTDTNVSVA